MIEQSNTSVVPTVARIDPTIRLRIRAVQATEDELISVVRAFAARHGYKIELRKRPLESLLWSARLQNATSVLFFKAEIDSLFLFGLSSTGKVLPEAEAKPIRDALEAAFRSSVPSTVIVDEAQALLHRE